MDVFINFEPVSYSTGNEDLDQSDTGLLKMRAQHILT